VELITAETLASYLRDDSLTDSDPSLLLILELSNGVVSAALGEPADDQMPTARQQAITLEVAARAWRNPDGYSSETVDDYTYRRDSETRRAGVYLTATEMDDLLGASVPTAFVRWLA
jgi:hypothetical protein